MHWSKADTKRLKDAIMSTWLHVRPCGPNYVDGHAGVIAKFRSLLDRHGRDKAAINGLQIQRATHVYYEKENAKTAEHYASRPSLCGKDTIDGRPEIVVRFERLAEEHAAKRRRLDALIGKVQERGLPPELETYDPTIEAPPY